MFRNNNFWVTSILVKWLLFAPIFSIIILKSGMKFLLVPSLPISAELANSKHFLELQDCGLLKCDNLNIGFTSALAKRQYTDKLTSTYRAGKSEAPKNLRVLNIKPVCWSSGSIKWWKFHGKGDFFQHALFSALLKSTAKSSAIFSELSVLRLATKTIHIQGSVDFFINGAYLWAIEVCIKGNNIHEHLGGKYSTLWSNDYVTMDIRESKSGLPTNIRRKAKRVTVFFKAGDYRACHVIYGKEKKAIRINLSR
jgi:hypothetical protein